MSTRTSISQLRNAIGTTVELNGWVRTSRSSGGIHFVTIRDGSGDVQAVITKKEVSPELFERAAGLTVESSVHAVGLVKEEPRSPGGVELQLENVELLHRAEDYPIAKKEHGTEFLMDHRHLWIRSARQIAILKLRDSIIWALRSFLHDQGFVLTDSPILTPTAAEGTTTLFKTDYHGEPAYLAQTGQLYIEATAAAHGRVYDFGPTFRAEKSKTRRHLAEFWMLDVEAAFVEHTGNMELQEQMITSVVGYLLEHNRAQLQTIGRDIAPLEKIKAPFPRMTYTDAIEFLQSKGSTIQWGDDLGAEDETLISEAHDQPVFIEKYPAATKAFYMQPDSGDDRLALCNDLIAPEGYGELIGGSQRIHDLQLLEQRLDEWKLPKKEYEWYLDLRRYGAFPHSGFGIGLERFVAWIAKLPHVREAIPFPRLLNRLRP